MHVSMWVKEIFHFLSSFSLELELKAVKEVGNFKNRSFTQRVTEQEDVPEARTKNH